LNIEYYNNAASLLSDILAAFQQGFPAMRGELLQAFTPPFPPVS
jgi:hypothetical protein